MAQNSKIEWCDDTVNAWIGCAKVSAGCANCYADGLDKRLRFGGQRNWGPDAPRMNRVPAAVAEIQRIAAQADRDGRPRFVFFSSMCDLFEDRPDVAEWRDELWRALVEVNRERVRIVALMLTKRPHVMLAWQQAQGAPLPEWAWCGTSVENQDAADERVAALCEVDTVGHRFLSCEPMLGPVDLDLRERWNGGCKGGCLNTDLHTAFDGAERCRKCGYPLGGSPASPISWVIVGGESGPKARPMHPTWARSLRDQCAEAGVHFFFKQWGEWGPVAAADGSPACSVPVYGHGVFPSLLRDAGPPDAPSGDVVVYRVGKKAAGRELDGRTYSARPEAP